VDHIAFVVAGNLKVGHTRKQRQELSGGRQDPPGGARDAKAAKDWATFALNPGATTMPTATDERLAADLASFRAEITRDMSGFRADLAGFQGEVKSDLKWIKGIGVALLLAAFSFAGWAISDMATVKAEVRQQESTRSLKF
jgi:hypothetical protein